MSKPRIVVGIDIDGKRIILDEESARALYEKLAELFGPKTVEVTYPYVERYIPSTPWISIGTGTGGNFNWLGSTTDTIFIDEHIGSINFDH